MSTASLPNQYLHPPGQRVVGAGLRALGEVLFWLIILQLVAGLFLQTQLAVFNRIVIPNGVPKLLTVLGLMALGVGSVYLQRGQIAARSSFFPACIFACYLVADLAWLMMTSDLPAGAILFGFNKYFLFFAALPAAALLRPRLSARQMNTRLVLILVPTAIVALAQFVTNDPLFPTVVEDESFEIPAVEFFGRIRAFSLFRGVLECGQVMAFFGAMMLARLMTERNQRTLGSTVLLALTAGACLVTFRRGAYLEYGAALTAAVAISRGWSMSRWLPWIYLSLALGLACAGPIIGSATDGMMSSDSLGERHAAWNVALEKWLMREDASLLVGTGMAQTSLLGTGLSQIESHEVEYFLVDNGFLAVGVQLGLIGLVLWCWVMQSLFRDMLSTAWRTRSTLAIATAALLSTWMMRDVFDPIFSLYPLYAFLVFWSDPGTAGQRSAVKPQEAA
jgi:hypothetical protein